MRRSGCAERRATLYRIHAARHFLLNVNIPAVPGDAMGDMRVTRLGKRHPSEPVVKTSTPYGDTVYWIGPVGSVSDAAEDTDFGAIEQNTVSITPLRFDLTNYQQLDDVRAWAKPLCANP